MGHEDQARSIHRTGFNCSNSVDRAFADVNAAVGNPPAPRSVAGKCGALLAAQKVVADMGVGHEADLERDFQDELGYVLCRDLKRNRVSCNDCVGVAARLADKYLEG